MNRRDLLGYAAKGSLASIAAATLGVPGSRAFAANTSRTHFTSIVIGSGFGGAVSALRLGQAGVDTLVLERGKQWDFDPHEQVFASFNDVDNRAFWYRWTADWPGIPPVPMLPGPGVVECAEENGLDIKCGAAVGGGSIVYTGAKVIPPRKFYDQVFPKFLSYDEMLATWYPKVKKMLGISPMPDDIYNAPNFTHSRIWDKHAVKAGYAPKRIDSIFNWDIIRDELAGRRRPSAIIGETDFGNSDGAKDSLTVNYLPAALATGNVQLRPLHEVLAIKTNGAAGYQVDVLRHNPDGTPAGLLSFTCDYLFLSAGSVNTNRLLVAARDSGALPNLPASVGTGFGDNGDQFSIYAYTGEPVGPTTQSAPIASAAWITDGVPLPMCVEGGPFPVGGTLPILMTITMTSDTDHRGSWVYDRATRKVHLTDWSPNRVASKQGCDNYTNHILATNKNCLPAEITWPFGMTVHPLGGCNLGVSTDEHGRIRGYKNLYAVDGSLMPGNSAAANPSLTIAAIAERCIADIIAKAG